MEMNYCRRCGASLIRKTDGAYECRNGHSIYLNASPTAGIFLFDKDDNLLLAVRGIEPNKGMLDTPGGFIDRDETIEAGLAREIEEELGLRPSDYSAPVYLSSAVSRYEHEGESGPVLTSFFHARLNADAAPSPHDDVSAIRWVKIEDVSVNDIGNDDIKAGFATLRQRLADGSLSL